ncbi:E3 ubiquitin-protein ligase MARCHF5 [Drosophila subobscura]|uniref:E3 ubiquitin-protein ligase MARCHF5 n=1 Tax=Drosophila subobscura TaxID=7241 RepID=UPI00155B2A92|nr:E3 ubiquitin-protein ligase MARCHF5 [Drosophila subobscura]
MASYHFQMMAAFGEQDVVEQEREREREQRVCWICFASEDENRRAVWVQPCQCRGATKWVHQSCLYRWIDEKQKGNMRRIVTCQQCLTEYMIVYPSMGPLAAGLELTYGMVRRSSPFVVGCLFLGAIYWSAMSFGATTVVQLMGSPRGFSLIANADTLALAAGLPLVPVALLFSRFIRWEDTVLHLIRSRHNIFRKVPILSLLYRTTSESEDASLDGDIYSNFSSPCHARVISGALMLPTLATLAGGIFFPSVGDTLNRNLLGGATYIAAKGLLNIYLRQKLFLRSRRRLVFDYTEENVRVSSGNEPDGTHRPQNRQNAGFDYDSDSTDEDNWQTDSDSEADMD